MNLVLAFLPLVVAIVLAVLIVVGIHRLLRHWVHPLRVLTIALSHAFFLLVLALAISLGGVLAIIWGALVAGTLVGIVIASMRALRRDPPVGTQSTDRPSRRERTRLRLAAPPAVSEIVVSTVLVVLLIVAEILAG